ncbi:MAG TPA: hypothetical protein VJS11_01220 [Acidobacteriaceae bacterium]|nr:hypothetical protein [Acidobacteriaceae bacterium]
MIVAVPCAFEVASPDALIVATPVLPEVQLAVFVRSLLLPSEYVPVALNCSVKPAATDGVPGVMLIELSVGEGGLVVVEDAPFPPPEQALSAAVRRPTTRNRAVRREQPERNPSILSNLVNCSLKRKQDKPSLPAWNPTAV